jgi:hypothetical protein
MLLCAASAQAQVDIRDKIGKPGPDLGDKISAPQNKELIKHSLDPKKLQAAIGPMIQEFVPIRGCPYPNPDRYVLSYRVNPAPDGARVREIKINYEKLGTLSGMIFKSPPTPTSGLQTARTVKDSRSSSDYLQTTGFVLQATDGKGRTSSRRIDYHYLDPNAEIRFVQMANRPREVHTPEGTFYEYAAQFRVNHLAIVSIDQPDHMTLRSGSHITNAPVSNVTLWESYSPTGARRALRLPSRRIDSGATLTLEWRSQVYYYTIFRDRVYDSWSATVRLNIRHPVGCSMEPRFVTALIPTPETRPSSTPESEPEPEPEPLYNAYRSEVGCNCNNRYVWANATVEGCLYNQNGSQWLCTAAQPNVHRLLLPRIEEPVSETPVTTCTWIPGQYRRISDEMDCNDVRLDPVVTDIAGEE